MAGLEACRQIPHGMVDSLPSRTVPDARSSSAANRGGSSEAGEQEDSNTPEPTACEIEAEPQPSEDMGIEWIRNGFEEGWVGAMAADSRGVLVAGAALGGSPPSQPVVMRLSPDGRELWRANLGKEIRSTLKRPHSAAVAVTGTASGHTYAVSAAMRSGTQMTAFLTRIDDVGRSLWTRELDLSMWLRLVLDENENAILVGAIVDPGGSSDSAELLGVEKYDPQGALVWSRRYPYSGPTPHVGRTSRGSLVLAAGFHGVAEFSKARIRVEANLDYHCADRAEAITFEPARALLTLELDADGQPVKHQLFETKGASVGVSGLAVLKDDRVVITGEYFGPGLRIGSASLCEFEPGMPTAEVGLESRGKLAEQPLSCRQDRRDLYVMQLSTSLTPLWARTLTLGYSAPQLAEGPESKLLWFVETSEGKDASAPPREGAHKRSSWLWHLDTDGRALRRRFLGLSALEAAAIAADGNIFTASNRKITKFSNENTR